MRRWSATSILIGMFSLFLVGSSIPLKSFSRLKVSRTASAVQSIRLFSSSDAGERATAVGKALGISGTSRHIFLCADQTKPKCCSTVAGLESWDFLKARLKELELVGPNALVGRTKANCLQVLHPFNISAVLPDEMH